MSLDNAITPEQELRQEVEHLKGNRDALEKACGTLSEANELLLSKNRALEEQLKDLHDRLDREKNAHFELMREVQTLLPSVTRIMSKNACDILDAFN